METVSGQKTFSSNLIIQNKLIFQSSLLANFFGNFFSPLTANFNIILLDSRKNTLLVFLAASQILTNKPIKASGLYFMNSFVGYNHTVLNLFKEIISFN
jgi:hypothetical protein